MGEGWRVLLIIWYEDQESEMKGKKGVSRILEDNVA